MIILPLAVIKNGEQLDTPGINALLRRKFYAIIIYPAPVHDAVYTIQAQFVMFLISIRKEMGITVIRFSQDLHRRGSDVQLSV